ncbi:hypothetical protein CQW23_00208 [Capsicum baccatum]|uniref:F-box domain-containing protein n=1 Tax=Capsicum baccatum TaxID=33114 RepID=A0A2G2XK35_CAPBA|nr:hypothetical protein CQW23_00208 [Capsicum baccatum]
MDCEASIPSNSMQDSNLLAEMVAEILSRLPVKSILKFRCVSKSWLALISSPEFIKMHVRISGKKEDTQHILICNNPYFGDKSICKECPVRSLFYDSVAEVFDVNYPTGKAGDNRVIVGSCNGLVFLYHYSKYRVLWNPTTRMYKNLPHFRYRRWGKFPIYGFGYGYGNDELHDDYKVVGIFDKYTDEGGVDKVEEMSLNDSGLFVNGKLHWDTISGRAILRNLCLGKNTANKKWEKIAKPSYGVGETDLRVGK